MTRVIRRSAPPVSFAVDTTAPAVSLSVAGLAAPRSPRRPPTVERLGRHRRRATTRTVTVEVFSGSSASGTPLQSLVALGLRRRMVPRARRRLPTAPTRCARPQLDAAGNTGLERPARSRRHGRAGRRRHAACRGRFAVVLHARARRLRRLGCGRRRHVSVEVFVRFERLRLAAQTIAATVSGGAWSATPAALADGTYTVRATPSSTRPATAARARRARSPSTRPPRASRSPSRPPARPWRSRRSSSPAPPAAHRRRLERHRPRLQRRVGVRLAGLQLRPRRSAPARGR